MDHPITRVTKILKFQFCAGCIAEKSVSQAPKDWSFAKQKFWCREPSGGEPLERADRVFSKQSPEQNVTKLISNYT